VLRELGVPATIFLATAYLDSPQPMPFDDWTAAGSPQVAREAWQALSTSQCEEMFDSGLIDLGTHTHTHRDFRHRDDAFRQDLDTSLALLRNRFGLFDATCSAPYGFVTPAMAAAAHEASLRCMLTTDDRLVRPGDDPFAWGRFSVEATDTPADLAARLDGWYGLARDVWQCVRRPWGANDPTPAQFNAPPAENETAMERVMEFSGR
jgi:peptidoglycan/xylan/chitin deacetylase (PgdA/CDA1 family)